MVIKCMIYEEENLMDMTFKQVLGNLLKTASGGNAGEAECEAETFAEEYNTTFDTDIQAEYDRQQVIREAYMYKLRRVWQIRRTV